jgi:hypothetical protein
LVKSANVDIALLLYDNSVRWHAARGGIPHGVQAHTPQLRGLEMAGDRGSDSAVACILDPDLQFRQPGALGTTPCFPRLLNTRSG